MVDIYVEFGETFQQPRYCAEFGENDSHLARRTSPNANKIAHSVFLHI